MSKLSLILTVGSIALALSGAAHADTTLRIGNSSSSITIPSNDDVRAQAIPDDARAYRNGSDAYAGARSKPQPRRQAHQHRQM